jgi:DNA-binding HxlR family transcriptional regulator
VCLLASCAHGRIKCAIMREHLTADSARTPELFIGKWTVLIINALKDGPLRNGRLRRRLGNVSQRMLTRTLRNLESNGLIARHVTRSKSMSVEYSLTRLGRTFIRPLGSICGWAARHNKELNAVIRLSHRAGGVK